MEKAETKEKEYYVIDIVHILKALWRQIWVLIVTGLIGGTIGFLIASFVITPTYSSSIMLYVNNGVSVGGSSFSITASQITAAQNLVRTYVVMLNNRTTLEAVGEEADVDYSSAAMMNMIRAEAVNETEVLRVTVTTNDPYEAQRIANAIAKVLPRRISEIIEGSTMEVVDSAVVNLRKVEPSITKYTAIGLVVGVLFAAAIVTIIAAVDNRIHDEDYLLRTYKYPILAKVPALNVSANGYGYGYGYGYYARNNNNTTAEK